MAINKANVTNELDELTLSETEKKDQFLKSASMIIGKSM